MEWDIFELVVVGLFSIGGFYVKIMFGRLDRNAEMLHELGKSQAAMHEQITSLFRNTRCARFAGFVRFATRFDFEIVEGTF